MSATHCGTCLTKLEDGETCEVCSGHEGERETKGDVCAARGYHVWTWTYDNGRARHCDDCLTTEAQP